MYEKEIELPEAVSAEAAGASVRISGPKGKAERTFKGLHGIKIEIGPGGRKVKVSTDSEERSDKALVGTIIAHVKNMAKGVTRDYIYKLRVIYSHFPVTVKVDDAKRQILVQNFLGEKTPRVAKILGDTKVDVKGPDITLSGASKEDVGQTAANLETVTQIKKHSRKVFQDGIFIVEKDAEIEEAKGVKQGETQAVQGGK
jgi:large subunit ribosomal protein L6